MLFSNGLQIIALCHHTTALPEPYHLHSWLLWDCVCPCFTLSLWTVFMGFSFNRGSVVMQDTWLMPSIFKNMIWSSWRKTGQDIPSYVSYNNMMGYGNSSGNTYLKQINQTHLFFQIFCFVNSLRVSRRNLHVIWLKLVMASHRFGLLIYKGCDKAFSCIECEHALCFGLHEILNSVRHPCRQAGQENFCMHMQHVGRGLKSWHLDSRTFFFSFNSDVYLEYILRRVLGITHIYAKHIYIHTPI